MRGPVLFLCLISAALGCSKNGEPTGAGPISAPTSSTPTVTGMPSAAPIAEPAPIAAPGTADPAPGTADKDKPIGQATMKPDRSIVLDLFRPAHSQTVYPPSHPRYQKVLEHVGPLKPGEQKLVMPWPDEIDDAKVEAAVHAWAKQAKWDKASYGFEITGTDKDGNVAVSVFVKPAGGKRTKLMLSPKSYQVVTATDFP